MSDDARVVAEAFCAAVNTMSWDEGPGLVGQLVSKFNDELTFAGIPYFVMIHINHQGSARVIASNHNE